MKALILAAGMGKRMGKLTANKPKPMVTINKKPILEYILEMLKEVGIRDFLIVTGYFAEKVERYFGDGNKFGVNIKYKRQRVLNGTGRVLNLAEKYMGGESFLMCYGDIITNRVNYQRLIKMYNRGGCDSVVTINKSKDPTKGAAVFYNRKRIIKSIIEKPPLGLYKNSWNNSGIYIFPTDIFHYTKRLKKSARGEYELTEAISNMIDEGYKYKVNIIKGIWSDVGTPAKVLDMEKYLAHNEL